MTTLFIADLHLDDARPEITTLFEHYLASEEARGASAFYILGDLVEAWIGDDDDAELPSRIATATLALRDAGVPVYFMVGNRDFLLGEAFAERAGMTLLDDGTVHEIEGVPTLLMHGDVLCTDDVEYQAVRKQVRTDAWKQQILSMPLAARRAFAAQARSDSKSRTGRIDETIMDVNQGAVEDAMRKANVTRLVHGHTHRPAVHDFTLGSNTAQQNVLGDRCDHGSVLRIAPDGVALRGLTLQGH